MEILIKPTNKTITATQGSTLLEAFLENQIPISYSCLSGRCGTCRCKVIEGTVSGPSAAEGRLAQHGQFVLACQSRIETDSIIEIPEPDEIITHPTKTVKAQIVAYDVLSNDVRSLKLKINKGFDYSPGQFASLTFWREDGTRSYSMAGVTEDDLLEFHIRLVPNGRVTSKLDEHIEIGASIKLNGPLGASYLRRKNNDPMLCVATGTGLAPILSIVRGALESGMKNDIHLVFGARTEEDLYGLDYLNCLATEYSNFQYLIALDHTKPNSTSFRGLVTDAIAAHFPELKNWRIYLAGAPAMVEAASLACTKRGADIERIYADAFYPSGV
ncbi:2Fe-2S iron-sulfur cluster-binding protein [Marinomonas polaris]|uniref:Ferredoxin-NAD(P)+ reductase (Naphthalene dioxygenase ferredoxin-specific) n=1 Tax=Marinomonas polaris DSM 16579 TaxID=1122206 RepID=A0A1M5G5D0_9GAMM|nr:MULTISPECIES: 2Fe-2S iron-sulfur cluster-binding protein [Marinomonas]PJE57178.1 ferredoxin oxidoreductase [Marinomonas sp. BSi20584]SHF98918.1 ferredoxin-NAD(P)+ reductase (naphthalene dioxygenase ferredoxin-specific) [Marinomonas polaris DSM 16579]|tara:strand:- start:2973 stop:3959 length:987 start_codon:yes stop_codon:yes gene_type:complete